MSKYSKILIILSSPILFCFGWCQNKKANVTKVSTTRKEYLFPYQTIIRKLPRDCADSRTDQSIYWLNSAQEKMLLPIAVTQREEEEVGEEVFNDMKKSTTFVQGEPLRRVQLIFDKMRPFVTRKLNFQIFVIDEPFENAFACPGGRMYLTLALLKKMNDDQVANIIGHEICHLEQKHCNVHLKYRKLIGKPLSNILDILTQGLSQRDELEADLGGLYLAYSAGYDPAVAVDAFKNWGKNDKPSFGNKIFRSHPYCQERVNCIESYLHKAEKNVQGLKSIRN
jgi:predicted Zn-dependent protease